MIVIESYLPTYFFRRRTPREMLQNTNQMLSCLGSLHLIMFSVLSQIFTPMIWSRHYWYFSITQCSHIGALCSTFTYENVGEIGPIYLCGKYLSVLFYTKIDLSGKIAPDKKFYKSIHHSMWNLNKLIDSMFQYQVSDHCLLNSFSATLFSIEIMQNITNLFRLYCDPPQAT